MSEKINVETQPNIFQRYLIPEESHLVRIVLQKAGEWGKSKNIFYSRILTVVLAICAVIFSLLNTICYLLQTPVKMLLNIIHLNPLNLIEEFIIDIGSALSSFLFVSFGATFIVAGILFPAVVFPYFSPENTKKSYSQLKYEYQVLKEKYKEQGRELETLRETLINHTDTQLRKNERSFWRFC